MMTVMTLVDDGNDGRRIFSNNRYFTPRNQGIDMNEKLAIIAMVFKCYFIYRKSRRITMVVK